MKLTHTITIRTHSENKTDTVKIHNDGPTFKVALPKDDARDRIHDAVAKLAYVLWDKDQF